MGYGLYLAIHVDDVSLALLGFVRESASLIDIVASALALDITYGVVRQEGESLSSAIGRTPTYQNNSVPQLRYVTEDIPTGLVVYEALAKMLDIECSVCTKIIDMYNRRFDEDIRAKGRNLKDFEPDYLKKYLLGKM